VSHILFVTPYFPPEVGAPQTRIASMASRLVGMGHQVTILTTVPNYPSGVVPPEYRHRARRREIYEGIHIIRVWSYIRPNQGVFRRILAQFSFGCLAGLLGARSVGHPDIIVVESPPLFDVVSGRLLSWMKCCPYIFTVADLWPEAAVQMGILQNRLLIWLAGRLERSAYRHAAAIWALTDGLRKILIQRGLPAKRVFVIPNGVDTTLFRPQSKWAARQELGWGEQFIILFAGTIGLAQGLETVLDAAEKLQAHPDIQIILAGEGATKAGLQAEARRRGLKNITFLGLQPHEQIPLLIAGADVCLAPLRRLPLFEATLPVKMYEAMACGRAIILAAEGESCRLASQEAGAAICVEPENPEALAQAILFLGGHPELTRQLGQHGRAYIETYLDRNLLAVTLERHITALLREKRGISRVNALARASVKKYVLPHQEQNHEQSEGAYDEQR
jgi:colanic acid biosynthesis glycosyl transferase WcaI